MYTEFYILFSSNISRRIPLLKGADALVAEADRHELLWTLAVSSIKPARAKKAKQLWNKLSA